MFDLLLIETGNGGDLLKKGRDVALTQTLDNMPYLAMFGGNVEADTVIPRPANIQDRSWWGNALLYPDKPELQYNSLTERTLHKVPLNTAGRLVIEEAIKADLEHLRAFCDVTVSTAIIATNVLRINILLVRPDNLENKQFIFIWDALQKQITQQGPTYNPNPNYTTTIPSFIYELPIKF